MFSLKELLGYGIRYRGGPFGWAISYMVGQKADDMAWNYAALCGRVRQKGSGSGMCPTCPAVFYFCVFVSEKHGMDPRISPRRRRSADAIMLGLMPSTTRFSRVVQVQKEALGIFLL